MRAIPSVDFWTREEFMSARKAQMEAHAKGETDCLCEDPMFKDCEEIVIDPGDEIICDSCNAEIMENGELINLVEFGRRVVCDECYQRWYAKEKITFRELREDGSLGREVQKGE